MRARLSPAPCTPTIKRRRTPWRRIPSIIWVMARANRSGGEICAENGERDFLRWPMALTTTSCPAMAAATASASSTSPATGCAAAGKAAAAGLRANAVTVCPAASACSTRTRPVSPLAPNTTSFAMRL